MKMMLRDETYNCCISPKSRCHMCALKELDCLNVPVMVCLKYGEFQSSDTKIFAL